MKKILLTALLVPAIAFAQTFPSPTFNSVTLQNPLSSASGGTGVVNSGTITLGGNLATSGANSLTLTTTGATNITLPMSGTLLNNTSGATAGANSNITSLSGLTTPLSASQGGTGIGSLGAGVATALGSAVTGSGGVVLGTAPTISSLNATGTPTAPTASAGTSTAQIATTQFTQNSFASPPAAGYGSSTPEPVAASVATSNNGLTTASTVYSEMFPGVTFSDQLQSVMQTPSSNTLDQKTAVAGYVKNVSPVSGIAGNAVALFGAGTAEVNNAATWGINTLLQDSSSRAVATNTGIILLGAELDFNIMSPGTQVIGVSVGGNSLAQSSNAQAYIVNSLGNGFKWQTGLLTQNGAATNGFSLGMSSGTLGANVNSQLGVFQFGDGLGVQQNLTLAATSGGTGNAGGFLVVGGSGTQNNLSLTNGSLFLGGSANGIFINGSPQVGPSTSRVQASNSSGQSIPNGTATIITGWTSTFDQHGDFNAATGVFTAPVTGFYNVDTSITYSASMTAGTVQALDIVSNGSIVYENQIFVPAATAAQNTIFASTLVKLVAGQTLHITTFQGSGGAVGLNTTGTHNTLSISQTPG